MHQTILIQNPCYHLWLNFFGWLLHFSMITGNCTSGRLFPIDCTFKFECGNIHSLW
uniref:Uncharacterized protein n=1 Tax=Arundo donax TaxID=35708 RepID=A0A0A8ZPW2_ARUDO